MESSQETPLSQKTLLFKDLPTTEGGSQITSETPEGEMLVKGNTSGEFQPSTAELLHQALEETDGWKSLNSFQREMIELSGKVKAQSQRPNDQDYSSEDHIKKGYCLLAVASLEESETPNLDINIYDFSKEYPDFAKADYRYFHNQDEFVAHLKELNFPQVVIESDVPGLSGSPHAFVVLGYSKLAGDYLVWEKMGQGWPYRIGGLIKDGGPITRCVALGKLQNKYFGFRDLQGTNV